METLSAEIVKDTTGRIVENKYKIIDILLDEFCYVYCYNCKFYDTTNCDYCHRKSMGWALSPKVAENIADRIIKACED